MHKRDILHGEPPLYNVSTEAGRRESRRSASRPLRRRLRRIEVLVEAAAVVVQQRLNSRRVGRGNGEASMMALVEPPDYLRVVVGARVGVLLASERDDEA